MLACWYKDISVANYSHSLVMNLRNSPLVNVAVVSSHCGGCFAKFAGSNKMFQDETAQFINFPRIVRIPPQTGIKWIINEVFQAILNLFRGAWFLSKCKRCDVIHYQQSSEFAFGIFPLVTIILIPTHNKKVVTLHNLHKVEYPRFLRFIYNRADALIVHSESLRSELLSMGVEPSKIRIIPHGVTIPPVLSKNERSEITFFGSPIKQKGTFDILEALKILKARGKKTTVHFYGICSVSERESFLDHAKKLDVSDCVVWGGRLSEQEFQIKMQNSIFTFAVYRNPVSGSNIITRAMANATPVIATDIGGLPEYLQNLGIIVPPANPKALAEAISRLKNNPELRAKMGKFTRAQSHNISWNNISKRTLAVYLEIFKQ